ncbi:MAG: LysE family transporter [Campylobacter sp.]|uniref:LysE family translocator n=1 Tax=Campylobacter sp. TaxID=205 RepID=UPI00297BA4F0|nr:LysE family transporter [Campylobacter sp.]MDD7600073.1 LysE family transporter [Campylobacteraceae bacterium]MDY5887439.1 LysE family transporter [Campylobacter sp.]
MDSFITGILLGLGVAIPIGPLNILIMNYSLSSFGRGFALGMGAMSADILYFVLLSLGVLVVFDNTWIFKSIAIFGAIFLLYMAWACYKNASKMLAKISNTERGESLLACYLKGLGLNSINPFIVGFWLSLSSVVVSSANWMIAALGVLLALFAWVLGLSFATSLARRIISAKAARIFSYVSAVLMLFFTAFLIYNTFLKDI